MHRRQARVEVVVVASRLCEDDSAAILIADWRQGLDKHEFTADATRQFTRLVDMAVLADRADRVSDRAVMDIGDLVHG